MGRGARDMPRHENRMKKSPEWLAVQAQSDRRGALLEELIYAHEEHMALDELIREARQEMGFEQEARRA